MNKQAKKMVGLGVAMAATLAWANQPVLARANDATMAITGATIFDATGKDPYAGTVLIRDGRIAEVGPDVRVPSGARIIRADGRALLPGFIDVHTHWGPAGSPGTLPQIASAYIASGVTTVNDFHQQPEAFEPLRAWLGDVASPHVNFVARMSTPGGHGADWGDNATTKWVATADAARHEVRALQAYRPDYIKAFADGWRYGTQPEETSMNFETLAALTDEAHKNGQRVLTHTVTVERGKLAALAGVDVIAHSIQDAELDADAVALIKKAGTFYAPTLAVYQLKADDIGPGRKDNPASRQRIRKWGFAQANLRALYAAGVPIAVGTDAGIGGTKHGFSTLQEMELLVSAGLTPKAALLAGTANSALALALLGDRGTIEKGKRADLVLVDGKPWEAIGDVHKLDRVFIDGKLVHGGGIKLSAANLATTLAASPAAELVDDFERRDGRSRLDTLRLVDMDGGVERSAVVANLVPRDGGGQALAFAVQMARKDKPAGGVLIPLRRGSVQPVDARKFTGVRLELRGTGHYQLIVNTQAGKWFAEVEAVATWSQLSIPFTALRPVRPGANGMAMWRGDDLLQVGVVMQRASATSAWGEIDNIRFY